MNKYVLKAEPRTVLGRSTRQLRRQGIIPAVIYGHKVDNISLQFPQTEFSKIFHQAGETSLIWISLSGESKERPTLVKSISKDPVTGAVTHVDLHQVNLKEKVIANIPVEIIGEAEMVKSGTAILDHLIKEIEVEALPTDLPEKFIFDISSLQTIGDHLLISSLQLPSGVELKSDSTAIVVALSEPQKEEEPLTPVVEAEVVGEEKAEEKKEGESTPEPAKSE